MNNLGTIANSQRTVRENVMETKNKFSEVLSTFKNISDPDGKRNYIDQLKRKGTGVDPEKVRKIALEVKRRFGRD